MVIRWRVSSSAAAAVAAMLLACQPAFLRPAVPEVATYRVLAIRAEPAEWERVVDPDTNRERRPRNTRRSWSTPLGTVANASLDWAFCTLPKPLTELNDVSVACFQNDPSFIVPLGTGPSATAAIPENTCRQFGPGVLRRTEAYRPADPDVTVELLPAHPRDLHTNTAGRRSWSIAKVRICTAALPARPKSRLRSTIAITTSIRIPSSRA